MTRETTAEGDLLVFEDYNCPGMVYRGTRAHWDGLLAEGGCPAAVNPGRIGADGLVDCGVEGRCPIRPAPDHWADSTRQHI